MWQKMCEYLIVAKTSFSCKYYTDGQRMKLIVYIIHGPFGDITLSYNLQLDVGCNFAYATKKNLVVNVDYYYFIITNWSCKLTFFF